MRSRFLKYILSLLISIGVFSCKKIPENNYTINSKQDIANFIKENKKTNCYEKKINEVNYKLNYISNEEMALRNVNDIELLNQTRFDSILKDYDSLVFFNLEISIDDFYEDILKYKLDGDVEFNYSQLVEYYSFKMQKDIKLVQNEKDTIPCALYHYERNYGLSPKTNIMIGFKLKNTKNLTFVYENKHLRTSIIKIGIIEEDILNHPHIKIG